MSFLLDTDTCSVHLKSGVLTHRLIQHSGRLFVSTITLAELYTWVSRRKASPRRLHGVLDLLQYTAALEVTPAVALRFGKLQAQLLDQGKRAPVMDLLIAATALDQGLILITHNQRHFARVPGLSLDDWLVP